MGWKASFGEATINDGEDAGTNDKRRDAIRWASRKLWMKTEILQGGEIYWREQVKSRNS